MKLPPACWMASAMGWQANRSSPRKTGRKGYHAAPASASRRCVRSPASPPVPGHDELRRQRQHLLMAGCDDNRAPEGMEILRAAVGTFPGRTALAMDLARAKMSGAIQRDEHPSVQAPERREDALCFDGLVEQRIECGGGARPASGGYRRRSEWRRCRTGTPGRSRGRRLGIRAAPAGKIRTGMGRNRRKPLHVAYWTRPGPHQDDWRDHQCGSIAFRTAGKTLTNWQNSFIVVAIYTQACNP